VRAVISDNFGGAFVDVVGAIDGGGAGTIEVSGATLSLTLRLSQIGSPTSFDWGCYTFFSDDGTNH
jgi:hypothetical protein